MGLVSDYLKTIQEEMAGLAKEVLPLVDEILAKEKLPKSKALFMRWKGDYSSHLAEVSKGDARTEWEDKSEAAYKEAMESDYKDVTKMMQKLHDNLVMWGCAEE